MELNAQGPKIKKPPESCNIFEDGVGAEKRLRDGNCEGMSSGENDKQTAEMSLGRLNPSSIFPSLPFQTDSLLVQSHTVLPFGLASVLAEKNSAVKCPI